MRNKARVLAAAAVLVLAAGVYLRLRPHAAPAVPAEIARAELVLTAAGKLTLANGGQNYTGVVFEKTTTGHRVFERTVLDGVLHGISKTWHDTGALEVEEHFVKGVSHGIRKRWHENGKLKNEATIVNGELHGSFIEWHEDDSMAARLNMVHGKGEGLCEAWHLGGAPKAKVMLVAGEPVKKDYFDAPAVVATENASQTMNQTEK